MTKEVVAALGAPKRICNIRFGMMDAADIVGASEVAVTQRQFYEAGSVRRPVAHGPLDPRLGTSDSSASCATCGLRLAECAGHFGHIDLALPVFHIGFFKAALQVLQDICKTCSRLLLQPAERGAYLRRLRAPRTDSLGRAALVKAVHERCRRVSCCPYCGAANGLVRKAGTMKIVHERHRPAVGASRAAVVPDTDAESVRDALAENSDLRTHLSKAHDDVSPLRAFALLDAVCAEDCELLGLDAASGHPRDFVWRAVPVPPAPIRPSVPMTLGESGSNEDDLSVKLAEIVYANAMLADYVARGNNVQSVGEMWDHLQLCCAVYVNADLPGITAPGVAPTAAAAASGGRPIRGLCQRLKGKTGRFRGNLSGKRVDFSARTVISPDPNLGIDEVAVPEHVARTLTYPEPATRWNIARLRAAVLNGPDAHPGANFVASAAGGKRFLRFGDRRRIARELRVGDVVERHLRDGDVVLFNRQPSLHKLSIMAHRAVVRPWRTFRFNECVCTPYNADFDGDEMNLHLPQTEEARAEALALMAVRHNLVTPRNGQPLVAAIQDFITAAHLLTSRDVLLDRGAFFQALAAMCDAGVRLSVPPPAMLRPAVRWTGKQVVTVLLALASHGDALACGSAHSLTTHGLPDRISAVHNAKAVGDSNGSSRNVGDSNGSSRNVGIPVGSLRNVGIPVGSIGAVGDSNGSLKAVGNSNGLIGAVSVPSISKKAAGNVKGAPYAGTQSRTAQTLPLSLEGRTRTFVAHRGADEMCPADGFLVVRNGEHLLGALDKAVVGGDAKGTSLFYALLRERGPAAAARAMSLLAKLAARWLATRGFSIGVEDVAPGTRLAALKDDVVAAGYAECDRAIAAFRRGELACQPGCDASQTLEATLSGVLSRIRDDVGGACIAELGRHNAPLVMQACGSKGSKINVSQMVACVGQQIIAGSRIPDGFEGRSLPHFPKGARSPAAKGFVSASFYSGLAPTEFFFHAVSGREGLVDTAVKTAETGYMQRRLMKALEDLSTAYDMSVRTSTGAVVQFVYGDDGLDPAAMEGVDPAYSGPANFARLWLQVRDASLAETADARDLLLGAGDVMACADASLDTALAACSEQYRSAVRDFFARSVAPRTDAVRAAFGAADANGSYVLSAHVPRTAAMALLPSRAQVAAFLAAAAAKYAHAQMEPGTAVGALGAQSIGEPGTQMTLKTFHFAGVASMNVTLGVPRIKEIINASRTISTPIITAALDNPASVRSARIVKGLVERTLVGDVCASIDEVHLPTGRPGDVVLALTLDLAAVRALMLQIDAADVRRALLAAPRLRLSERDLFTDGPDRVLVRFSAGSPAADDKAAAWRAPHFAAQAAKRLLPAVPVCGVPAVRRAVINDVRGTGAAYNLLVEGYGLAAVMGTPGVDGRRTTSNHVMEAQAVLGIEAARATIAAEIQYTMAKHGMTIDARHVFLLADTMTAKGEVLGITRFGIAKMKDSVLMLASFERTTDHLFDAARFSKQDDIDGVSECIIMGIPMPIGTGACRLLHDVPAPPRVIADLVFESLL